MDRKKKQADKARVEFGSEFGDFNAVKAYEIKHMTKQTPQKNKQSGNQCGGL